MQKREIEVGKVYAAKVSNRLVAVKVTGIPPSGTGFFARNLNTDRLIRIKTAGRLRFEVHRCGRQRGWHRLHRIEEGEES